MTKSSETLQIEVGDVYRMRTGEGMRITQHDPVGGFRAQLRSLDGEWGNLYVEGDSWKLPQFLVDNGATKMTEDEWSVQS